MVWQAGGPQTHSVSSCHTEQLEEPRSKATRAVSLNPVQEEDKGAVVLASAQGRGVLWALDLLLKTCLDGKHI